ncbi:SLATT domain-containing protein [Stigmatella aurantiaca]|uniref:SLATT domain-containing protein n=1 Tax=Stigmatella aurantiaca TaxID=41 RepID=UPI0002D6089A|nr:SLATT domain-containing protein [Stigmatella aurantiaca]
MPNTTSEKPTDNLRAMRFPSANQPEQDQELQDLYNAVVAKIEEAIHWYDVRKAHHKYRAVFFRGSAITLAGLASILPIAVSMFPLEWAPQRWVPVASIFAALGASCIALDRLYGFSSTWMRYLAYLLELQTRLEMLQFGWTRLALETRLVNSSKSEGLIASLNLLQNALSAVNQALKNETSEWVAHFTGALAEFEKSVTARREAAPMVLAVTPPSHGALKVQIAELDTLDNHRYELHLDEASQGEHTGATKAFTGLGPGQHLLRVTAKRKGNPVSSEDVVTITPGETTSVVLTLS